MINWSKDKKYTNSIDHLHNYGPGTRSGASPVRIGCDVCVSHLSFCFSSVLECRSAITLVFPRCSDRGRASPSLFFHSVQRSSELRKHWFLATRQADWSNFRVPNSTIVCIAHVLPEKNFRFHARALEPVDSSITRFWNRGRLDTSR